MANSFFLIKLVEKIVFVCVLNILFYFFVIYYNYLFHTPNGRTVSELAWHSERLRVHGSLACSKSCDLCPYLHRAIRGALGVLPCVGYGVTANLLDLPFLTPLSKAGCGRLQQVAPNWDTSVALLQVVDN